MAKGKMLIKDNISYKESLILCASEIGGTAVLVFLGCMGCVTSVVPGGLIPHEQISFTFGLAVMVAIQIFGHISGGHINPAVTVAAAALGNMPLLRVPVYLVGQILGGLLGYAALVAVTPTQFLWGKHPGVCSPGINPSITPFQGCLMEFFLTLILVLACCGVWDSRNSDKHDSVTIRLGLTIAVLAMAGGPYTGANMNPARSFAPALFNNDWENHWAYWIGPLASGLVGAILYRIVFAKDAPESKETLPEELPLNEKP